MNDTLTEGNDAVTRRDPLVENEKIPPFLNLHPSARSASRLDMVAESDGLQAVRKAIEVAAAKDVPVCLCGENGTGKSYLAGFIHALGPRSKGRFLSVHCEELPEPLLNWEIFGYAQGVEKTCGEARPGIFEEAADGVVLLEEFNGLPEALQAKLGAAFASGAFRRVKGTADIPLQCRILVTVTLPLDEVEKEEHSNTGLVQQIKSWSCITIPPLRERKADILPLLLLFLKGLQEAQDSEMVVEPEALDALHAYPWPGNVAELRAFARVAVGEASNNTISGAMVSELLAPASCP